MVENHALAMLHLEEALLEFDEALATGEPVDDDRTTRKLCMHYNIIFTPGLHTDGMTTQPN